MEVRNSKKIPWIVKNLLQNYPSYKTGQVELFGKSFLFNDASGFRHSYQEIFVENIYRCVIDNPTPLIIDCGANTGMSIIYLKTLFPEAQIIAFEPEVNIFRILKSNIIDSFGYKNIELINKAVWISDGELTFESDGSLGGHLVENINNTKKLEVVKSTRLKNFLKQKVDFLKLDIEGAENDVLVDIADELSNVEMLFIEYHSSKGESQKLGTLLDIVTRGGFRYYIKQAADYKEFPFIDADFSPFDLQLNIFCSRSNILI